MFKGKKYYLNDGKGTPQLFDEWPFRLRQRVWSDEFKSVKFAPGNRKDSAKGPGYLSTNSAVNKHVGLLL